MSTESRGGGARVTQRGPGNRRCHRHNIERGLIADCARRPATFQHTPEQCGGSRTGTKQRPPFPVISLSASVPPGSPANTSTALCREEARQAERGPRGVRSRRAPGGASGRPREALDSHCGARVRGPHAGSGWHPTDNAGQPADANRPGRDS